MARRATGGEATFLLPGVNRHTLDLFKGLVLGVCLKSLPVAWGTSYQLFLG
jgi:hypothetical protein